MKYVAAALLTFAATAAAASQPGYVTGHYFSDPEHKDAQHWIGTVEAKGSNPMLVHNLEATAQEVEVADEKQALDLPVKDAKVAILKAYTSPSCAADALEATIVWKADGACSKFKAPHMGQGFLKISCAGPAGRVSYWKDSACSEPLEYHAGVNFQDLNGDCIPGPIAVQGYCAVGAKVDEPADQIIAEIKAEQAAAEEAAPEPAAEEEKTAEETSSEEPEKEGEDAAEEKSEDKEKEEKEAETEADAEDAEELTEGEDAKSAGSRSFGASSMLALAVSAVAAFFL